MTAKSRTSRLRILLAAVLAAAVLAGPAQADTLFPAGGWLPAHAAFSIQRADQGRDFVTNWRGIIQAPGFGCVTAIGADNPFPFGFGPRFPLVDITTGAFAGHVYYIGHTTALVRAGQCFRFGAPLARADQGRPSEIGITVPGNGGWVELGEREPDGRLGPFSSSGHWYDHLLFAPLLIRDPYDIYPTVIFQLGHGQHGAEDRTVKIWDSAGCENPVLRAVCKSTRWHLQLERDRDVFVAHNTLTTSHGHLAWTPLARARWTFANLGPRVQGLQHRITAPPGRRCTVTSCA